MPLGPLTGSILLKTERMRNIQIDPLARIARVEAGAVWIDVVEAAARHGLATLAGSSPNVGVVGYTLGGGLSFLSRRYGLSANNVHAIEVVTAHGKLVRADHGNEPDLFWALRGGGGSFGVVTAIELRLFPITQLDGGILWYPIERGAEVMRAWRELTRDEVPDELTTLGRFLRVPPLPDLPAETHGKSFVLVEAYHVGNPAQADELLSPFRALGPVNDTMTTLPIAALPHVHMDPDQPVVGVGDGIMLASLPGEAIDALFATAGSNAAFPLSSVEVRHLGGELSHRRRGDGVVTSLQAPYLLFAASITPVPGLLAPSRAQIETVKDALAPWAAQHMYLNFAETPRAASTLWPEHAYHRLRQIKASVDPHDLILSNHPVPPAR